MTRLIGTALVLAMGALAFGGTGAVSAEEPDKAGRVKVQTPAAPAAEVRGWDPKSKAPVARSADEAPDAEDPRVPPPNIAAPVRASKTLNPPVIDDRQYRELDEAGKAEEEASPRPAQGELRFGDGVHGRRPPPADKD